MSTSLLSLILFFAGMYLCLGATLFVNQGRFIYFPDRILSTTPAQLGLPYQSVTIDTIDGVKLHGWFIPADSDKSVILFCHGNGGNISHRLETIDIIHRLGHPLFIFDYRGYGKSEGHPTETGTYLDVEAAWNYLIHEQKIPASRIILFGRSLGGPIAAWISSRKAPRACILESSFTSAPAMAAAMYPFFPAGILCRFRYDTLAAVKNINCPLLIIHSPEDEIIPFRHGLTLFEAAHEPKTFLQINGNHNSGFLLSGKFYEEGLATFLAESEKRIYEH
ncbi:MAG: alpha/beta hydrolase [Pseudomonadota bacterium]